MASCSNAFGPRNIILESMAARRSSLETLVVPDQGHAPHLAEADVIAGIAGFISGGA